MGLPSINKISFDAKGLSSELLLKLHQELLLPRLIENKMLLLRRQGRISKWFSGFGQEAVSVGCTAAINSDEYILPRIRNLGVFTSRVVPLEKLFSQFEAKAAGFTKGRDRTFHFNSEEHKIIAAPSLLGPQLEIALGLALAHKLRDENKLILAFSGDGESSQGAFHEALNVASVWKLPIIFVIENNGYALSTPSNEQYACKKLSDRALGYGMEGITISGNNILEVYNTISSFAATVRTNPRPVLIECETFRMRGHEEGSGTSYVPQQLQAAWAKLDPLSQYQQFLIQEKLLSESKIEELTVEFNNQIEVAREYALAQPEIIADEQRELAEVYYPGLVVEESQQEPNSEAPRQELRMIDAIHQAIEQSLERDEELIIMGQDIAEHGGVFKSTKGLVERFGKKRILNTPLCESAILGAAAGLGIAGIKSIVLLQFADFTVCGMNQLVNIYSKWYYRSNQSLPIVVRLPSGAGVNAGPLHSASYEAWFTHTPGLKVVCPSNPYDAKGLLATAIEDPNPVMFFEHKGLYRSSTGDVPCDYFKIPFGKAKLVREGEQATIVSYGIGVQWAKSFLEQHREYSIDLLDLRTLTPLDFASIELSIKKTGRALVLCESPLTGGFSAELSALITERCFSHLDAPVVRCANLDTPVPAAAALEERYLAKHRLQDALFRLLNY